MRRPQSPPQRATQACTYCGYNSACLSGWQRGGSDFAVHWMQSSDVSYEVYADIRMLYREQCWVHMNYWVQIGLVPVWSIDDTDTDCNRPLRTLEDLSIDFLVRSHPLDLPLEWTYMLCFCGKRKPDENYVGHILAASYWQLNRRLPVCLLRLGNILDF